jgi:hypothetical protein
MIRGTRLLRDGKNVFTQLPLWSVGGAELDEQSKRRVHISWAEAQRAETERDRARQAYCKLIPNESPLKLFRAKISEGLPKLKATAYRFLSVKSH